MLRDGRPFVADLFVGNERLHAIAPGNRCLNYGDGLFETMRIQHGELPLWPRHLARLREGAARLCIRLPDIQYVEERISDAARGLDSGVIKLLLTRGDGGRGYAPATQAEPVWMLSYHALPPARALHLQWCELRLAPQPALAGIKHCNRLEQVLARVQVQRLGGDEGLLLDIDGNVVSATAANLLVRREGRWTTPPVDRCGVAGVLRGWLLDEGLVEVQAMDSDAVGSAQALALCNAVRGILTVASLDGRTIAPDPALDDLHSRLAMAYPMFKTTAEPA